MPSEHDETDRKREPRAFEPDVGNLEAAPTRRTSRGRPAGARRGWRKQYRSREETSASDRERRGSRARARRKREERWGQGRPGHAASEAPRRGRGGAPFGTGSLRRACDPMEVEHERQERERGEEPGPIGDGVAEVGGRLRLDRASLGQGELPLSEIALERAREIDGDERAARALTLPAREVESGAVGTGGSRRYRLEPARSSAAPSAPSSSISVTSSGTRTASGSPVRAGPCATPAR